MSRAAAAYAERMHAGQVRPDGTPFIHHPEEVASLLRGAGAPDHLVAAGMLHDVIEKAGAEATDLQLRFGSRVTQLVTSVSDDDRISGYATRKAALRQQVAVAGEDALMLFAADKLSKLRELRREIEFSDNSRGVRTRQLRSRRLRHYARSLALLEERLPDVALVRELRAELDAFVSQRAPLTGVR
ncbi:MAG TPA: HD domain-containing protein [Solirubrobacteraceae bacterium]|nr:HD domain-containing protein [Solirubrobacteraceae bacterium]